MGELLGVDNRVDALDLTAADLKHQHADHSLLADEQ